MKPKKIMFNEFKKYQAQADNIDDFLNKYTKSKYHADRGKEYVKARIESHKEDLKKYGYTFITHHCSVTGDTVSYYGQA